MEEEVVDVHGLRVDMELLNLVHAPTHVHLAVHWAEQHVIQQAVIMHHNHVHVPIHAPLVAHCLVHPV